MRLMLSHSAPGVALPEEERTCGNTVLLLQTTAPYGSRRTTRKPRKSSR